MTDGFSIKDWGTIKEWRKVVRLANIETTDECDERNIRPADLRFVDDVKPETTQEDRGRLRRSREFHAEMERERLGDKAYFER